MNIKKILSYGMLLVLIPAVIVIAFVAFGASSFVPVSIAVALISVCAFIVRFEREKSDIRVVVIITVMAAMAILGRVVFSPFPGIKPVSAIIILCAVYMGSEAGFLTGALTAAVSNFYFGHGPWTVLQMFVWGLIGFIAGALSKPLSKSRVLLCVYGFVSGAVFSLFMDVWTVLWMSGDAAYEGYGKTVLYAFGFTALYSISNAVFLLILNKPVGGTLKRLKIKYGIEI
ncbi:MAG: ECF transporter S component [Clostridia bacterium]|nr:ECF transporter S component [Clostridia bacterium]